jgi:hypothetical protein
MIFCKLQSEPRNPAGNPRKFHELKIKKRSPKPADTAKKSSPIQRK